MQDAEAMKTAMGEAMMAILSAAPQVALAGPSTTPGAPQITPTILATAINSALATLYGAMVQFDASGSLEVPGPSFSVGNGGFVVTVGATGTAVVAVNLPDFDPHNPGQLWNNAGTLAISGG